VPTWIADVFQPKLLAAGDGKEKLGTLVGVVAKKVAHMPDLIVGVKEREIEEEEREKRVKVWDNSFVGVLFAWEGIISLE